MNVQFILMSIIPAITYALIIYISLYYKSASIKLGLAYMILGGLSTTFVHIINYAIPYLHYISFSENPVLNIFLKDILTVGIVEELSKYLTVRSIEMVRHVDVLKRDKPSGIMFYSCMVSMGFAIVENISYAKIYETTGTDIRSLLMNRAISAVVAHMICGIILGYFISLSKQRITNPTSTFTVWLKTNPVYKKLIFVSSGVLLASLYHGLYDGFLECGIFPWNLMALGLLMTFFMNKHLNYLSKDLDDKNYFQDTVK